MRACVFVEIRSFGPLGGSFGLPPGGSGTPVGAGLGSSGRLGRPVKFTGPAVKFTIEVREILSNLEQFVDN